MYNKRFVIRQHRPWRDSAQALVMLAIMLMAGYTAYYFNQLDNVTRLGELKHERTSLQQYNNQLRLDNERLREQVATFERAAQIDIKAFSDVGDHLEALQDENLALEEEVAFYRNIVAENRDKGLRIETFLIDREAQDSYRFELVLTRTMNSDKVVSGTIELSVAGVQGSQAKRLPLKDLSDPETSEIAFEFKYFQRLQGRLVLPPDFVPHQVYVKVNAIGSRPSQTEMLFGWSKSVI